MFGRLMLEVSKNYGITSSYIIIGARPSDPCQIANQRHVYVSISQIEHKQILCRVTKQNS